MGELRLTVQFDLHGFSGPRAVERFSAKQILKDLQLGLESANWSTTPPVEIARHFTGNNTERFTVLYDTDHDGYVVWDQEDGIAFTKPTSSFTAKELCDVLNDAYE